MKMLLRCLFSFLIFSAASVARADVVLLVKQDVSSLFGASAPPSPFYLGFKLNSGDAGLFNNSASVFDFGLSTGVALVGTPIVTAGNATGTLAPGDQIDIGEGGTSLPFDYTSVLQQFTVTSSTATLTFSVGVTDNFTGAAMSFSPDLFTYQLLYDHDGNPLTVPVPVVTTVVPGNIDFVQYELKPDNYTPSTGGPFPGFNPPPLDGLGAASVKVIPEPGSLIVWGIALTGFAIARHRRKAAAAPSVPS